MSPAFDTSGVPGGGSISGGPAEVPGTPASFPGASPQLNVLGRNDLTLNAGFVQVRYSGFLSVSQRGAEYVKQVEDMRHRVCQKLAVEMEAWAKANAPWNDVTGDAREGLRGIYVPEDGALTSSAIITHTVEYGVFLEAMQSGTFAIILPTLLHFAAFIGQVEQEVGFEFASSGVEPAL